MAMTVLVVSAHPDDDVRHMGGTMAQCRRLGCELVMVTLTRGQKGTYGTPDERVHEFRASANVMGAVAEVLDMVDTEISVSIEHRHALIRVLRQYKPNVVFAPYPQTGASLYGNHAHPDHATTGVLVQQAVALSNTAKVAEGAPHRVHQLLFYMLPRPVVPNIIVPITDGDMRTALEAVRAQASQLQAYRGNVPLEEYLTSLRRIPHRHHGIALPDGCDLSEAFLTASPVVCYDRSLFQLFAAC